MQTIVIQPDVLKIHFLHQQEPTGKPTTIQTPSNVLESVLNEWMKKQPTYKEFKIPDIQLG